MLSGEISPKTSAPSSVAADAGKTGNTSDTKGTWIQKAGHVLGGADGVAGIVEDKSSHKAGSSEEKGGKMSHLKGKLKDKLHIGSKDK